MMKRGRKAWSVPVPIGACLSLAASLWLGSAMKGEVKAGIANPGASSGRSDWLVKTWTTDDGLPGSDVTGIVQTADGYLWLGTFDGLVRFDGLKFTVFDRSNTPDLPSNAVVNLHLDERGVLWISTDRGMVSLREGHWKVYGVKEGWTGIYARTFAEGSGKLFVTSFEGRVFQFREDQFEELATPPGQPGGGYIGHVDERGRLWVFQNRYFGFWDGVRWSQTVEAALSDKSDVMAGPARDGCLWVFHHGCLEKFRFGEPVESIEVTEPLSAHWSLTEDREGNVWLASYRFGLTRFSPDKTVERLSTTNGLSTSSIRCVFEDSEGDRWVGSGGGGLMRLKRRPIFAYGESEGVPSGAVRSVAIGKLNTVYLGCYGGGVAYLDWKRFSSHPLFGIRQDGALIDTILFDKAGRLWAAQPGTGLLCLDGQKVSTNDVLSLPEKQALALFEDSSGRIWLSDPKRVQVFEDGKWSTPAPEPGLALESVRAFAEDRRAGVIWMGAYNGDLYQCTNGGTIHRVVPFGDASKGAVIALLSDDDGTLWLGSVGSGLGRLRQGQLKWIGRTRGLPANEIGSVLDDGLGSLWMGSRRGIIQASRVELNSVADGRQSRVRSRLFDASDGMPVAECNMVTQPNAAKGMYGELWFATRKGVAVARPEAQSNDTHPPPVHIEAVDFIEPDGRARHLDRPFPAKLVLPAGVKRLQIRYIGVSLASPEKVTYRQRVEGLDRDWVEVGHEQSATLQDPGPGTFEFRVTAANAEGIWNETGASLAYTVLPKFWQTGWFRALVGLLLVGEGVMILGLVANHWRSSRLREELRDNQGRWDMASVAAKLGLWTWDVNTGKFWATDNAYALLGRSSSEAITFQQVEEAQHPDDRESAKKALQRALQNKHEYDTEFRVLSPDGEPRWLSARGVVDFDKHGKAARLRGVWIDLTARKGLEIETARQRAELAHMGRVAIMGELSASLAHEVNQPLTAILSNAQAAQRFLDRTPSNTDEVRAILIDIVAEDRRAGEVIRRMRSMLRKGVPEFQSVDVNKLVRQVLMLMRSDLVERNVPVMTHLAPGLPLVEGDPIQMQQVLLNLILNGCDAMQDRPAADRELRIETEPDGKDMVRISVIDRGVGAPASIIEKMFDPFVTTKGQGLGMGLALSRSIIAAHGGRIWAAINEGPGLTLSFTLKVHLETTT